MRLGEDRKDFLLHARRPAEAYRCRRNSRPRTLSAQNVFGDGEKRLGTGTSSNCRDGHEHDVAINRFDGEGESRARGNFFGE